MSTGKKKLFFLGQLGAPGRYDPAIFAGQPGGDDEIQWFDQMLQGLGLNDVVDFQGRSVCNGAAVPNLDEADAVVVGGSYHSVHDDLDWQQALRGYLSQLRNQRPEVPVFGICGGHQQMSMALGGDVKPLDGGARVGTFPVLLSDDGRFSPLFDGVIPRFHFGNEEHVPEAPAGATVLATAQGMPACALDYGANWMSVQFHPEVTADCITASWGPKASSVAHHYEETPEAPQVIANFLKATGVL